MARRRAAVEKTREATRYTYEHDDGVVYCVYSSDKRGALDLLLRRCGSVTLERVKEKPLEEEIVSMEGKDC